MPMCTISEFEQGIKDFVLGALDNDDDDEEESDDEEDGS